MPNHWTYTDTNDCVDLCQGDIIARTPELISILKDVHGHFTDPKYTSFMILTQSCDLVRRNQSPCSTRHISLCVIREIDQILPKLLNELCGSEIPGIFIKDQRYQATQLISRIVNQNEQAMGLFYLHEDADAGIATHSAALLRITISLRRDHYDTLVKARVGRISPEFSAKLGWLTGNLYARVATPDWGDKQGDISTKELASDILNMSVNSQDEVWLPQSWFNSARAAKIDFSTLNTSNAFDALKEHSPPNILDSISERFKSLLIEDIVNKKLKHLKTQLSSDEEFFNRILNQTQVIFNNSNKKKHT